jgi:Relaxase/Mobilisation nuclease domain
MIGKVSFGSGVRGLTRYLTQKREPGLVGYVTGDQHELGATAYRNLAAENAADAAREMDLTARLSTCCEKPFMHLSLSWHPSERPEEPRMIEAMDRVLAELGLDDRQAVYAVHREKEHQHIHAAVNRVGREGTAWDRWQCKERISAQCRVLEREMGFEPIDKHLRSEHERDQAREQIRTPREQRIYERSGIEPPARAGTEDRDAMRERIGKDARSALRGAENWEQAHERLRAAGVALEAYAHPKTARTGLQLVEIATGERMAASGLGSDYGRRALEKRLGAFEATRSLGSIRGRRGAQRAWNGPLSPPIEGGKRLPSPRRRESAIGNGRLHRQSRRCGTSTWPNGRSSRRRGQMRTLSSGSGIKPGARSYGRSIGRGWSGWSPAAFPRAWRKRCARSARSRTP